jgi:hypothetical protein
MTETSLHDAEARVLAWLHEQNRPVSPRELLERSVDTGLPALGIRAAFVSLVERGAARFTSDSKIEAISA